MRNAKPLGLGALTVVAVVLSTTMDWGEADTAADTAAAMATHTMGAPARDDGPAVDAFFEQKKAAKTYDLPDQF